MSKSEAARVIQRAFRSHVRRNLVKKLNKEVVMKFIPGYPNRQPRRDKVLELFKVQKKETSTSDSDGYRFVFDTKLGVYNFNIFQ